MQILFLFWKKIHLDIRTLSVEYLNKNRIIDNKEIRHACCDFKSVSIINPDLFRVLSLPLNFGYSLPLGADIISNSNKD